MAAAIGAAASAPVTSPSAAIWKACSVVVIPTSEACVCVSGLPVTAVSSGSAKLGRALAMRSLRERLTGAGGGSSPRLVTWSGRGVIPGRATPVITPVRVVVD